MKLSDGRITLRPATPADEERLWEILQEPEIVRWWGHEAREDLQSHLAGREQAVPFVIEHAGATAGMIQYCEENDPEFRHAGIDIYLTARLHGRHPPDGAASAGPRSSPDHHRPGGRQPRRHPLLSVGRLPGGGRDAGLLA